MTDKKTFAEMGSERDDKGLLTPLASALDAISNTGCDCETPDTHECLACLCEEALRGLWEANADIVHEVERLRAELTEAAAALTKALRFEGRSFCDALNALRSGERVAREIWDGNKFLRMQGGSLPRIISVRGDKISVWELDQSDVLATDWFCLAKE
jgi:hypothetical protein